jgi:hypothetical protein
MTHTDALNKILAHSCPRDEERGVSTFHLDLCCNEVLVKARYLGKYRYEILSVDLVDCTSNDGDRYDDPDADYDEMYEFSADFSPPSS